jgi:hypothetical protein
MRDDLSRLDSATLSAWRIVNLVGWPLLAAGLAMIVHLSVDAIVSISLNRQGIGDLSFSPSTMLDAPLWIKHALRASLSVGLGVLIGGVVRNRVWRSPTIAATIAAAFYTIAALTLIELYPEGLVRLATDGPSRGALSRTLAYEIAILLTVPVAWWWARSRHQYSERG